MVRLVAVVLLILLSIAGIHAQSLQSLPFHYLSTNSNNSTLISGAGQNVLKWIIVYNNNAQYYYLKLYDKKSAPVCGTDIPVITIPLPPNNTNSGVNSMSFDDTRFTSGIGFCIVANQAD